VSAFSAAVEELKESLREVIHYFEVYPSAQEFRDFEVRIGDKLYMICIKVWRV